MVDILEDFDPSTVPEDDRSFDLIPAGDYLMQVIESDLIETKSGSGHILKLTCEILEGPNTNRRVWINLNIRNQNPQAQQIAQRDLADLCIAVGVASLRNSDDLHFKPFIGKVKIKPAKDGFDAQNTVSRFKAMGGAPPTQPAQRQTAQPAQRQAAQPAQKQAASGARPWSK